MMQPESCVAFPTVGIGSSAGGLRVLQTLLQKLPPDTGAAFVVIMHLEPTHNSELAEILTLKTRMPVRQVTKTMRLEPNCVYVIPPNYRILMAENAMAEKEIGVFPFEQPRGKRLAIDEFFHSLADQGGDAVAVILTGAGSDGSLGAKAVKESGGLVLVQDPEEAEYPSMPRSAIATGAADVVAPVRELAKRLTEILKVKIEGSNEHLAPSDEETLKRILTHLRSRTGHDFLRYKRSTIYRRVSRRMQVGKVETAVSFIGGFQTPAGPSMSRAIHPAAI